jgi:hypothetical protein
MMGLAVTNDVKNETLKEGEEHFIIVSHAMNWEDRTRVERRLKINKLATLQNYSSLMRWDIQELEPTKTCGQNKWPVVWQTPKDRHQATLTFLWD